MQRVKVIDVRWAGHTTVWNGMDWKGKIGMEYGMAQVWNGRFDGWNGTKSSLFHTNSILAHFSMALLKSGFSFIWTYQQTKSEFDKNSNS